MSSQNQSKQTLLEITLKAVRDASYKERLMTTPLEAIKEVYPEFTTDANIVVLDQTAPNTIYINVSPAIASLLYDGTEELELCEEDLELVSGGGIMAADDNWICGNNVGCGSNASCSASALY